MCGIFCSFIKGSTPCGEISKCRSSLQKRGPDVGSTNQINVNGYTALFSGNILWTQGEHPTSQPYVDRKGNILLWNGDVYSWNLTMNASIKDSDTKIISDFLCDGGSMELLMTSVHGPYSIIYYDCEQHVLWVGRDPIGRISLLWNISVDKLIVTSVGHKDIADLEEVPAIGLFRFDLNACKLEPQLYQWSHTRIDCDYDIPNELQYFKQTCVQHVTNPEDSILQQNDQLNISKLLLHQEFCKNVSNLIHYLSLSVEKRTTINPKACKMCEFKCDHAKVAILFSGGIDSALLALLASKYVESDEPIDLLNVSFERPADSGNFECPDRQTCLNTLEELKNLCPTRQWNLIKIDIPSVELQQKRLDTIRHLIYPLKTVLDDSLGCSLWFASRGLGKCNGKSYKTPARVLLSGMGADELLGGYTRYRKILQRHGWQSLNEELDKDFSKIPSRNLGRDNRVCCDHGRQLRTPYLDEHFIEFIRGLAPWQRCWPKEPYPINLGEKLLLRLAAFKLGLVNAACLPKRALQFGSRIANKKENGNDLSDRL
ncbi:PREDICTED: asparagine synthetase domain-containing protein 1 isoform X1 [Diuraphis noxia]|uniref:asparagine synthetase domain-containing protein 1 isoform X1 n=1 Tax=Diuraphis noxia TaxID=143948 RepID=UPI00076386C3|nr:PREDICTED: asparagine synthetase domain-containing protein 1 isoform X1 [Diuraphis noxia]XP_015371283.1 PREDICTED: asparagine synthetase domain-containing protein 1 isoform X1 [Diuraphis noxia]